MDTAVAVAVAVTVAAAVVVVAAVVMVVVVVVVIVAVAVAVASKGVVGCVCPGVFQGVFRGCSGVFRSVPLVVASCLGGKNLRFWTRWEGVPLQPPLPVIILFRGMRVERSLARAGLGEGGRSDL